MTKTILKIILLLCLSNMNAQQKNEDYKLLDIILTTKTKENKLHIYEKPSDFINKETFFSKDFLIDYTHPTIGVDSKKVKKLIKKLDFNYLSNQKSEVDYWDFSKISISIFKYVENSSNQFDKIRRLKVSRPIYSKDLKMAFIYYEDICGYIGCGSANVIVLKKCNGTWKEYVTIPIFIS